MSPWGLLVWGVCCAPSSLLGPTLLPRVVRPQDLDACRPLQMDVLYHKAHIAFKNMSGSAYFARIKPFLGEPGGHGVGGMPEVFISAASFSPPWASP